MHTHPGVRTTLSSGQEQWKTETGNNRSSPPRRRFALCTHPEPSRPATQTRGLERAKKETDRELMGHHRNQQDCLGWYGDP